MNVRSGLSVLLALALGSCAAEGPKKYSFKLPEYHGNVDSNGLRVIILPDPSTDLVEIDVRYEVGGNEDPDGKHGIAHMVEHIMFQQKPIPDQPDQPPLFAVLQQLSLYTNAYTTWDTTHYQNLVTADNVEAILAIEAARMSLGCKTVSNEQFEREREVVRNEYRQNWSTPQMQALLKIRQAAYPPDHPYYGDVIGNDAELSSIQLADICKFMEDYYTPSRATLIIAGNVTQEQVLPLIGKYFGGIPKRDAKPRRAVAPITLKRKVVTHEMDVDDTMVAYVWAMPAKFSEDWAAASYARNVVMGLAASDADEWEFATGFTGVSDDGGLTGHVAPIFGVVISLRDAGDVDKAVDTLDRAAKRAYRFFDEAQDFDENIAREKADLLMSVESLNDRTDMFGDFAQFDPEGGYFLGALKRLDAVSTGDIRSAAKRIFDPGKAVIVVIKKKKGAEGMGKRAPMKFSAATADDRNGTVVDPAEAQQRIKVTAQKRAPLTRFKLGNGMQVVLAPRELGLPLMGVSLMFRVGYAHEPREKAGLARTAATELRPPGIDMGAGGEVQSANVLGRIGAHTDSGVTADTTTFDAVGLNIYDEVLIKGMERWIKAGEYDQEAIESRRKYLGFSLRNKSAAAQDKFSRAFAAATVGTDHPYASTGQPTLESLGHFGRDAAMAWKNAHYTPGNATLVVTGRFDPVAVEKLIRDNFGSWTGGSSVKPISPPTPPTAMTVMGVDNEPTASATVRVAFAVPSAMDGQYGARLILAEMLSGRMKTIREKLGSSYGVGAGLRISLAGGAYIIGGQIDMDRLGVSLRAIQDGIESLRKGEDFDAEFARARRVVLKQQLTSSSTVSEILGDLLTIVTFGLSDSYYDKLAQMIGATSPEQVKSLIEVELAPAHEVLGVMGERAKVDKAFAEAGLGGAKWVD
jgi:zinc protease